MFHVADSQDEGFMFRRNGEVFDIHALRFVSTASLLHFLGELLRVLPDGLGQLGHRVEHQVVQNHLEEKKQAELLRHSSRHVNILKSQHTKTKCSSSSHVESVASFTLQLAAVSSSCLPPAEVEPGDVSHTLKPLTGPILLQLHVNNSLIATLAPPSGKDRTFCSATLVVVSVIEGAASRGLSSGQSKTRSAGNSLA